MTKRITLCFSFWAFAYWTLIINRCSSSDACSRNYFNFTITCFLVSNSTCWAFTVVNKFLQWWIPFAITVLLCCFLSADCTCSCACSISVVTCICNLVTCSFNFAISIWIATSRACVCCITMFSACRICHHWIVIVTDYRDSFYCSIATNWTYRCDATFSCACCINCCQDIFACIMHCCIQKVAVASLLAGHFNCNLCPIFCTAWIIDICKCSTICKCILSNHCKGAWEIYFRETCTSPKCWNVYICDTLGNWNTLQFSRSREHFLTDDCQFASLGKGNGFQVCTLAKCSKSYVSNTCRNCDVFQSWRIPKCVELNSFQIAILSECDLLKFVSIVKCLSANFCYTCRDFNVFNAIVIVERAVIN